MPEMFFGFKAAGGAPVARQRPGRLLQGLLHGCVVFLRKRGFACQPSGSGYQGRLKFQVLNVALARCLRAFR
ncbi:MAG: hypothetical protein EBR17_07090 [Betaproteobacteria bacterium]|nr:hypothetical protein [Betaproteobacteria bacterium]